MTTLGINGASSCPKFKLILLGDSGVGKTSLFLRIRDNEFTDGKPASIGVDTCARYLKVDNEDVQMTICDTAGVERFRTLTRNFYRNAQAVLLVYSVDEPSTLFYLSKWEQDAREYAPTALRFLIGNKVDKDSLVSQDAMEGFATSHNCEYAFLTSAKTGQGITDLLAAVAERLLTVYKKTKYDTENSWLDDSSIHVNHGQVDKVQKSSCC